MLFNSVRELQDDNGSIYRFELACSKALNVSRYLPASAALQAKNAVKSLTRDVLVNSRIGSEWFSWHQRNVSMWQIQCRPWLVKYEDYIPFPTFGFGCICIQGEDDGNGVRGTLRMWLLQPRSLQWVRFDHLQYQAICHHTMISERHYGVVTSHGTFLMCSNIGLPE